MLKRNNLRILNLSKKYVCILNLSLFIQSFFILYGLTGNPLYDYWVFMIYILGISMFFTVYTFQHKNKKILNLQER
ncbi:Uncharacterised protein [Clostridioides difficile]|nr:Uncharacterised protein [Clostridioides difficile]